MARSTFEPFSPVPLGNFFNLPKDKKNSLKSFSQPRKVCVYEFTVNDWAIMQTSDSESKIWSEISNALLEWRQTPCGQWTLANAQNGSIYLHRDYDANWLITTCRVIVDFDEQDLIVWTLKWA